MASELKKFNFNFQVRSAPKSGPTDSDLWNDTIDELSADLASIATEWNNKLVKIIEKLPAGAEEGTVNAFVNGLDGKNLWVSQGATSSTDSRYYNSVKARPNTVYDQFEALYTTLTNNISTLENTIAESGSGGLTDAQKSRIGANVFNSSHASSSTSLDGKSENNRLNIIQLAKDFYGSSFSLDNDGTANLTNSLFAMVDALLELHGGNWDNDIALTHSGAFSAAQTDVGTSHAGDDTYTGSPSNLKEDLNRIRNAIKTLKGTAGWLSSPSALYSGGADSLEDLLASTAGTGTKSATNPWGYNYSDVDGLNTRLEAIKTFTGQGSQTDNAPSYSSTTFINNGDSLETAIGRLDTTLASVSGLSGGSQLAALELFVGQDADSDSTPDYSSTFQVVQGTSLETAIGALDLGVLNLQTAISGLLHFTGKNPAEASYPTYSGTNYIAQNDSLEVAVGKLDQALLVVSGLAAYPTVDTTVRTESFHAQLNKIHRINPTGVSGLNAVLPLAANNPSGRITFKNQSDSSDIYIITASGSDTIDGDVVMFVSGPRISVDVVSDGTNDWMVV